VGVADDVNHVEAFKLCEDPANQLGANSPSAPLPADLEEGKVGREDAIADRRDEPDDSSSFLGEHNMRTALQNRQVFLRRGRGRPAIEEPNKIVGLHTLDGTSILHLPIMTAVGRTLHGDSTLLGPVRRRRPVTWAEAPERAPRIAAAQAPAAAPSGTSASRGQRLVRPRERESPCSSVPRPATAGSSLTVSEMGSN
jgi:hypothetical protein